MPSTEKPGLQPERTRLAWERTSFGFMASAAIPLMGRGPLTVHRTLLGIAGVALAVIAVYLGHRRSRDVTVAARSEILFIGWATAAFAAAIIMFLIL